MGEEPSKTTCHRLFLIRHGETVDNVAGLYGGIRDAALTNHGILQAQRLAAHFVATGVKATNIYSSNLQRAFKTAEAIRLAQLEPGHNESPQALKTVQYAELQEQNFGSYEGKPFGFTRQSNALGDKSRSQQEFENAADFQEIESKESMATRATVFLDTVLWPVLAEGKALTVVVVAHGIILSSLWKCILKRQRSKSVTLSAAISASGAPVSLEHLGGWSNTAYLELELRQIDKPVDVMQAPCKDNVSASGSTEGQDTAKADVAVTTPIGIGYTIHILCINNRAHLTGLKRLRGVGSSKHDEGQQSIKSFFKKQKTSEE